MWDADDHRLSQVAGELLESGDNELLLSVSVWEMAIKAGRKRLQLQLPLRQVIADVQRQQGLTVLAVELAHVLETEILPDHHRDPFDRMIVAQARVEGLPIVSGDPNIRRYEVETIW
jgi:PIN domain nuclease of toxin-antitoxin system